MRKLKRVSAVLMTGIMIIGMSTTAFAAPTSVEGTGAGKMEGKVTNSTSAVDVTLPTYNAGDFDYVADPYRIIQDSNYTKYKGGTFPDKSKDTCVYWNNGGNKWANSSKHKTVINKSYVDIAVTATAKVVNTPTVKMSKVSNTSDGGDIYLALNVGGKAQPITTSSEGTTTSRLLKANTKNFDITFTGTDPSNSEYVYTAKPDAKSWNAVDLWLDGACRKFDCSNDAEFPQVKVTWSYTTENAASVTNTDGVYDVSTGAFMTDRAGASYISASSPSVSLTLPSGVSVKSVVLDDTGDGSHTENVTSYFTVSSTKVAAGSSSYLSTWYGNGWRFIRIYYSDDTYDKLNLK